MSEWDKLAGEAVQFGEQALENKLGAGQDQQGQYGQDQGGQYGQDQQRY